MKTRRATELCKTLAHDHVPCVVPDPEEADLPPPPDDAGIRRKRRTQIRAASRRVAAGARIVAQRNGAPAAGGDPPLLVVSPSGCIAGPRTSRNRRVRRRGVIARSSESPPTRSRVRVRHTGVAQDRPPRRRSHGRADSAWSRMAVAASIEVTIRASAIAPGTAARIRPLQPTASLGRINRCRHLA